LRVVGCQIYVPNSYIFLGWKVIVAWEAKYKIIKYVSTVYCKLTFNMYSILIYMQLFYTYDCAGSNVYAVYKCLLYTSKIRSKIKKVSCKRNCISQSLRLCVVMIFVKQIFSIQRHTVKGGLKGTEIRLLAPSSQPLPAASANTTRISTYLTSPLVFLLFE
jgi:hypothetical protein